MELLELPFEMLQHIATFLNSKMLAKLSETCKDLYHVSNIDALWQALCQNDYCVSSIKGWDLSFKEIYTKILYQYPILGFKRLALQPFGGLLHIVWTEGEIQVGRIFPGQSSVEALVCEPAYSLTWDRGCNALKATCVHSPNRPAPASISKAEEHFMLHCSDKKCFCGHRRSSHSLGQSDKRIPEGFKDYPGAFKSFNLSSGYNCPLLPMDFLPIPSHFPFNPGFYRADYGDHGVEITQVKVNKSNPYLMECLKITGDPNVPAGNVSVMVYLDKPVVLEEKDQMLIEDLTQGDEMRPEEAYAELLHNSTSRDWRQPFILPRNCFERNQPPKTCLARYLGHGRIAGHNFNRPSLCNIHVAKFDDDTFGIVWLELFCFMMMHREKQSF